ncbi:MAG: hypothetical protein Q8L38_07175, partial [Pseudohongiella sp.]|nr:hypothetical protein [Pseudohongiella sp.]
MSNYRVTRDLVRYGFCLSLAFAASTPTFAQQQMPETADGKPDFSGLWQAMGSAHWNIEPSAARTGPDWKWGALGAIPATLGVVQDGELPYTPSGLAQKHVNQAEWLALDPLVKCYMPGIPRANMLP